MTFQSDIAADADIFFDTSEFGSAAVYRAKGSVVDVDCTVIVNQVQDAETAKMSRGEAYYAHIGRLWCQIAEIAAPGPGDVFTVAGAAWIVQEVLGASPVAWELSAYRSAFAGKIR